MSRTLMWFSWGPLVKYTANGVLEIHDLNPSTLIKWRIRRWELFRFGLRTVWVSIIGG